MSNRPRRTTPHSRQIDTIHRTTNHHTTNPVTHDTEVR